MEVRRNLIGNLFFHPIGKKRRHSTADPCALPKPHAEPPLVVYNDGIAFDEIKELIKSGRIDNIVISPGPGTPAAAADIGVCLQVQTCCDNAVLRKPARLSTWRVCASFLSGCRVCACTVQTHANRLVFLAWPYQVLTGLPDTPILGVCLGHQALALVHGAAVVRAPEPVHGRLSELCHSGHPLFAGIPSGPGAGYQVGVATPHCPTAFLFAKLDVTRRNDHPLFECHFQTHFQI